MKRRAKRTYSPDPPPREHPDPVGQLAVSAWVRLLKAHALILRQVRRNLQPGLTVPQFDVLAQLYRREEGMTPKELTHELLVTAGNVTGIVDRLVTLRYVERCAVPGDRRTICIRLTGRGRRLLQRAIPQHRRDVQQVLERMGEADLSELRDLLGRLNAQLAEQAR